MRTNGIDPLMNRIQNLDLDCIKFKLMHEEDGEGWTRGKVDEVERRYRRFLCLAQKHDGIVPTKEIDTFWHYHILDTKKYAADCDYALGHFLHHFPYLGLRGNEDARELDRAFDFTCQLYEAQFGEPYDPMLTAQAGCKKCKSCGSTSACSNKLHDEVRPSLAQA